MKNLISWGNLGLRWKLLMVFMLAGLLPFAATSIFTMLQTTSALEKRAFDGLSATRYSKQSQLEAYLNERRIDSKVLAETVATAWAGTYSKIDAIQSLQKASLEQYFEERFKLIDDVKQDSRFIKDLQLFKAAFSKGVQTEEYKRLDIASKKRFKVFLEDFGFNDIYLIDNNGKVIYSVLKRSDFGAKLNDGKWKDTGLGKVFARSRSNVVIEDFSFYGPSNDQAAFIATPLTNSSGKYIGSAVFQLSMNEINKIVQTRTGFDSKTESYLVGLVEGKTVLRSTRVVKKGAIGSAKKGPDVDKVLSGQSGDFMKTGSTGSTELSIFKSLDIRGLKWGGHHLD